MISERLEKHINLKHYTDNHKNVTPKGNAKLMRICLIAGLSDNEKRNKEVLNIQMSSNSIHPTLFTVHNLNGMLSSMIKLPYHDLEINWDDNITKSKVVNAEIFRGFDMLMKGDTLHEMAKSKYNSFYKSRTDTIIKLKYWKLRWGY